MATLAVVPRRQAYQDYMSWQSFGTGQLYSDIADQPALAGEYIARHLNLLLLRCPSEKTSADVAAAICVAMHGPVAAQLIPVRVLNDLYDWFKALYNLLSCAMRSSR